MASISYSFLVTIVYFSTYALVFFITSIYCAIEIVIKEKNKDNDKGKCSGCFKSWLESVWAKKRVYLEVIPHIFDQATCWCFISILGITK